MLVGITAFFKREWGDDDIGGAAILLQRAGLANQCNGVSLDTTDAAKRVASKRAPRRKFVHVSLVPIGADLPLKYPPTGIRVPA